MKTFGSTPEILVIDDIYEAASSYAEFIYLKYKLSTICVSTKDDAIEVVKTHNIKVAVIDQVMPDMLGTELFKEIKKINAVIYAIMLTGEVTSTDIGNALNNGFKKYIHKADIKTLPEVVLQQYIDYEISILKKTNEKKFLYKERKLIIFPFIKYFLSHIDKVNTEYLFKEKWRTISTINVGEEKEIEEEMKYEDIIIMSDEVESKIKSDLSICFKSIPSVKKSINFEITHKYKSTFETSKSISTKNTTKYKLPNQPEDINEKYIIKRVIEANPIFIEYRLLIEKECIMCNHSQVFPIIVYKQTRKFATKQIDYYSDGSKNEVLTGNQKY